MKQHQKCFSLRIRGRRSSPTSSCWCRTSSPEDGGAEIVAGNEKVIRARLSDAKFFWEQDLKKPLDEMAGELAGITFHEKLGTQKERVERIAELAFQIAGACDAVPEDARRAAQLAKADLVSGMVGEFPELQGLMGRYYAEHVGTKPEIARAIELHYKPKGPTDTVPQRRAGRRRGGGRGARRQARHAGRLLGHRREADGLGRSLSAAPRGAGRDPDRAGE